MGPIAWISVYFVVWWTVLFTILPIGIRSHEEEGSERIRGADWGAPANPNIKRKFITTTWVSAILWLIILAVVKLNIVSLPTLPAN